MSISYWLNSSPCHILLVMVKATHDTFPLLLPSLLQLYLFFSYFSHSTLLLLSIFALLYFHFYASRQFVISHPTQLFPRDKILFLVFLCLCFFVATSLRFYIYHYLPFCFPFSLLWYCTFSYKGCTSLLSCCIFCSTTICITFFSCSHLSTSMLGHFYF